MIWLPSFKAPMPPPKPALDSFGQALGPTASRAAAVQVLVPTVLIPNPAGPLTVNPVTGSGSSPGRVEAIEAPPEAFVGEPSLLGVKATWKFEMVSAACAVAAPPRHMHPTSAAVKNLNLNMTLSIPFLRTISVSD